MPSNTFKKLASSSSILGKQSLGLSASKNKVFTHEIENLVDQKILNVANAVVRSKSLERKRIELKVRLG